jgi:hypothetical protein
MLKRLLPLLLLTSLPVLAQEESIPLVWDQVPEATGYRIFYSPLPLDCPEPGNATTPALTVDVSSGAFAGYVLTGLNADTEYHIAVKALLNDVASADCSNIVSGWPSPRITSLETTLPEFVGGGAWEITVLISGTNFRPDPNDQAVLVNYPEVTLVEYQVLNSQSLRLRMRYTMDTPGGQVEVYVINNDGSQCDYTAPDYTGCVRVLAGTIDIVPVAIPSNVTGLDWWVGT